MDTNARNAVARGLKLDIRKSIVPTEFNGYRMQLVLLEKHL